MSDSLLIAEITTLHTRLSEAEAENRALRIRNAELDLALNHTADARDDERSKREEAERALRLLVDSLNAWERKEFASTSEAVVVMRAMILRYGSVVIIPAQEKQEKTDER